MLRRAKTILKTNLFTALYDKGYYTGSELAIADALGIKAIVAIPHSLERLMPPTLITMWSISPTTRKLTPIPVCKVTP